MKKEDWIYTHQLLDHVREYAEQNLGTEFKDEVYQDEGVNPTAIWEQKEDHRKSTFALAEIMGNEFSGKDSEKHQQLLEKEEEDAIMYSNDNFRCKKNGINVRFEEKDSENSFELTDKQISNRPNFLYKLARSEMGWLNVYDEIYETRATKHKVEEEYGFLFDEEGYLRSDIADDLEDAITYFFPYVESSGNQEVAAD